MRTFHYFFADFTIPVEGILERDVDEAVRVLKTLNNLATVNCGVRRCNVTPDTEYFKTIFVGEDGLALVHGIVRFYIELPDTKRASELAKTMFEIGSQYGFSEPRVQMKTIFAQ